MSPETCSRTIARDRKVLFTLQRAVEKWGFMREVFTDGLDGADRRSTPPTSRDATVRLGEPLPAKQMKLTDPIIVVEVLSPSSVHMDTSAKLIGLFQARQRETLSGRSIRMNEPSRITSVALTGTLRQKPSRRGPLRLDPPGISVEIAELMGRQGSQLRSRAIAAPGIGPVATASPSKLSCRSASITRVLSRTGDFGAREAHPACGASIPCCGNRARAPSTGR